MELTVKQEHLAKALNIIGKVANGTKIGMPILMNVIFRVNGKRLLIAATNLEIAISQNIGAKIEKIGEIAVPAKLVADVISNLPKEDILLKVQGDHLLIECGNYKSKINGISTEDFPELPNVEISKSKKINLSINDFKTAVNQTAFTASTDTSRPILTGVFWHSFEGFLYLAATDGYRLSEKKVCEIDDDIAVVIPVTSLNEVMNAISNSNATDEIEILFDEDLIEFHIEDITIVSKPIDGKFVDYRRLIPEDTQTKIEISKDDFSRIVKVSSLFAQQSGGSVTLHADGENSKLSIHSIASEFGENTSEADAEIFGEGEVTLNPVYLTKAFSVLQGNDIQFGFSGKLAPTVIREANDKNYIHIIMPLKS